MLQHQRIQYPAKRGRIRKNQGRFAVLVVKIINPLHSFRHKIQVLFFLSCHGQNFLAFRRKGLPHFCKFCPIFLRKRHNGLGNLS